MGAGENKLLHTLIWWTISGFGIILLSFPGLLTRTFPFCYALQVYNTFPWLVKRLPGPHQRIFSLEYKLRDYITSRVKEHKENLDPSSPRDYIDYFLIEMGEVSVICKAGIFFIIIIFLNVIC